MPLQKVVPPKTNSAFLDDLMERLSGILPLLEQDETVRLLGALLSSVSQDIAWDEGLAARQTGLLHRIPDIREYPILMDIHGELNELEMERFIKMQSVPALHKNCTEYRDLLVRRALQLVGEELAKAGRNGAPVPFALISMGSDGRGEQTLITD